jgi:Skp family chaperone for outer membrane proteins
VGSPAIVHSWFEYRSDRMQLEATLSAQKLVIQQAREQMENLQDANDRRDAQAQATIAAMQQAVTKLQTPQQISAWIPSQLPGPIPISLVVPNPTAANPTPNAIASIPQEDLPAIRDTIESCKECAVKLNAAQQDLASTDQQLQLAGQQLSAVERQRDAAIAAAKGGPFWQRLRRNTKWFLYGLGMGATALCATGHCK